MNPRSELLQGAEKAVNGDRNVQYGDPNSDFKTIAALWNIYLERRRESWYHNNPGIEFEIQPHDVAIMIDLQKSSRIAWDPTKFDSWMDKAGYSACGWDCVQGNLMNTVEAEPEVMAVCNHEVVIWNDKLQHYDCNKCNTALAKDYFNWTQLTTTECKHAHANAYVTRDGNCLYTCLHCGQQRVNEPFRG